MTIAHPAPRTPHPAPRTPAAVVTARGGGRGLHPVVGSGGMVVFVDYLLVPALIALVTANGLHAAV